jgi:hypothetical protein
MWTLQQIQALKMQLLSANNLNEFLDLMHLCFERMNSLQCEALLGFALNIAKVSIWIKEEEKRRENKSD